MRSVFKRILSVALSSAMIFTVALTDLPVKSYAENNEGGFSFSGSGTEEDPYILSTVDDLVEMRDKVNDYYGYDNYKGKYFKLTNDIDLSGIDNWTPIGNDNNGNPFGGIFDGGGYEIKNMTINCTDNNYRSDMKGFFSRIDYGTVKNLTVSGSVTGRRRIGGIAGQVNGGTLENCVNKCIVTSINTPDYTGGIAGEIRYKDTKGEVKTSYVINCVNLGNVSGNTRCGGIAGEAACVTIRDCRNEADITGGEFNVGGIAGYARDTSDAAKMEITGCENSGKVTGKTQTGGIVGRMYTCNVPAYPSTVNNCVNSGETEGEEKIGGIVGENDGNIELCINNGVVKGVTGVGGICGYNDMQNNLPEQRGIRNCINSGAVTGTGDYTGGLVGNGYNPITSYNTGQVTGGGSNVGGAITTSSRYCISFFNSDLVTGSGYKDELYSAKSSESFNSGEVAWLFNQEEKGNGNIWGQNIDNDMPKHDYPVFSGAKVYRYEILKCDGSSKSPQEFGYTNKDDLTSKISGHTLAHVDANYADCANKGNIEYWHCSVCDKNFSEPECENEVDNVETDKTTDHKWDNGKITVPPTEESKGIKTFTCTVCKIERTEEIDKLVHTHTFSEDWTSDATNHWHGSTCGHDVKDGEAEHEFGDPEIDPSTCIVRGSRTYTCKVCRYQKIERLELAAHNFGGEWQKNDKQHWKECSVCGAGSETAAHVWDSGKITVPPTEESKGIKTFTCTVCKIEKTEEIDKLVHTHTFSEDWTSDATNHWHGSTCGHDIKDAEAQHEFGDPVIDPSTCIVRGSKTYTCKVCRYQKIERLELAGHSLDNEWQKDQEYHWKKCTLCDYQSEKEAHTWDNGTVTKPAASDKDGEKTFKCSVCNAIRTEIIPATGTDKGDIFKDVQLGENVAATVLTTPLEELITAVLTSEEQDTVNDGTDIKIILTVDDATDSVPAGDKAAVESKISTLADYKLAQYLDVGLLKIIGDAREKVTKTNDLITIVIEVPQELRGKSEYSVIRVHSGETTVLSDLDEDPDTITIKTDRFSTYALAYREKSASTDPSEPGSESPGESGSESAPGESGTAGSDKNDQPSGEIKPSDNGGSPSTGDAFSFVPLAAILSGMVVIGSRKKK